MPEVSLKVSLSVQCSLVLYVETFRNDKLEVADWTATRGSSEDDEDSDDDNTDSEA